MNKSARIQKRLILLIAFSITWIFIGSLVIFHQEQVMGKTFKWNKISFIVPKSKDEKTAASLKAETSSGNSHDVILAVLDDNTREQLLSGSYSLLPQLSSFRDFPCVAGRPHSLRAPPLA